MFRVVRNILAQKHGGKKSPITRMLWGKKAIKLYSKKTQGKITDPYAVYEGIIHTNFITHVVSMMKSSRENAIQSLFKCAIGIITTAYSTHLCVDLLWKCGCPPTMYDTCRILSQFTINVLSMAPMPCIVYTNSWARMDACHEYSRIYARTLDHTSKNASCIRPCMYARYLQVHIHTCKQRHSKYYCTFHPRRRRITWAGSASCDKKPSCPDVVLTCSLVSGCGKAKIRINDVYPWMHVLPHICTSCYYFGPLVWLKNTQAICHALLTNNWNALVKHIKICLSSTLQLLVCACACTHAQAPLSCLITRRHCCFFKQKTHMIHCCPNARRGSWQPIVWWHAVIGMHVRRHYLLHNLFELLHMHAIGSCAYRHMLRFTSWDKYRYHTCILTSMSTARGTWLRVQRTILAVVMFARDCSAERKASSVIRSHLFSRIKSAESTCHVMLSCTFYEYVHGLD